MGKYRLFIGFKNGKAETMLFTVREDYESAIDCDYKVEAAEGTEMQQLQDWLKSLP